METKSFGKGEVIYREGDPGSCMYDIYTGRVGVYSNYGTPEQTLLEELYPDHYFGDMGLLEHAPRAAAAVSLSDDTVVGVITEADFPEIFRESPSRIFMMMQQMSMNLRRRTTEYLRVCQQIHDLAEKEGIVS